MALVSVIKLKFAQPNVMKLIHNTFNHKTKIKFEFWWSHFYCSRVVSRYKWNQMFHRAQLYTTAEVEP